MSKYLHTNGNQPEIESLADERWLRQRMKQDADSYSSSVPDNLNQQLFAKLQQENIEPGGTNKPVFTLAYAACLLGATGFAMWLSLSPVTQIVSPGSFNHQVVSNSSQEVHLKSNHLVKEYKAVIADVDKLKKQFSWMHKS